jgi:hypothetical protein
MERQSEHPANPEKQVGVFRNGRRVASRGCDPAPATKQNKIK